MKALGPSVVAALLISVGLISCSQQRKTPYLESLKKDLESLKKDAKASQEEFLASTSDATKKREFAADHFFGYYLITVESKANYCRQLGVDISPFITAFRDANKDVYVKATSLLAKQDLTENQLLFKIRDPLVNLTFKVMADQAAAQNTTTTVVCESIRDNGSRDPNLAYRKSNSDLYRMLMDAK
jgi:hypothetical protein